MAHGGRYLRDTEWQRAPGYDQGMDSVEEVTCLSAGESVFSQAGRFREVYKGE
jgi:hypothetical protein